MEGSSTAKLVCTEKTKIIDSKLPAVINIDAKNGTVVETKELLSSNESATVPISDNTDDGSENTAHEDDNDDDDASVSTSTTDASSSLLDEEEWDREEDQDGDGDNEEEEEEYDIDDDGSSCASVDDLEDEGVYRDSGMSSPPLSVDEENQHPYDGVANEKKDRQDEEEEEARKGSVGGDDQELKSKTPIKRSNSNDSNSNDSNKPIDETVLAEQLSEGPLRIAFFQLLLQRDQTNLRNLQLQRHLNRAEKQLEELTDQLNKSTTFVSLRYNDSRASPRNEQKDEAAPTVVPCSSPPPLPTITTTIPESNPSSDPIFQSIKTNFNAGNKPLKWLMKGQKITQFGIGGGSASNNNKVLHPPYKPATVTRRLRPWSPRSSNSNHSSDDDSSTSSRPTAGDFHGRQSPFHGLPEDFPQMGETVTFYPIRTADRPVYIESDDDKKDSGGGNAHVPVQRVEI
eukprot:scaffold9603_cov195-Amphora_coffeaeformis.AAC.1